MTKLGIMTSTPRIQITFGAAKSFQTYYQLTFLEGAPNWLITPVKRQKAAHSKLFLSIDV